MGCRSLTFTIDVPTVSRYYRYVASAGRLTRAESKARTRDALLDVGHAVFLRDGFHGASLNRVAAEAGFTKGAVYAHFTSKADLFLAIVERRVGRRIRAQADTGARARSYDEMVQQASDQWGAVMREERAWSLLLLEFWVYAARDSWLRARIAAQHQRTHDAIARSIQAMEAHTGTSLAADKKDLATVIMAFGNGLNLDGLLFSDTPRVDLYERTLITLLDALR
jgi:AcrR family transcriptional regulator